MLMYFADFERIREELRDGRNPQQAIHQVVSTLVPLLMQTLPR